MTEPEQARFDPYCFRCGELIDWLEMWSERDQKFFKSAATPGTFQLHVNVCPKAAKRPRLLWQNPNAVVRGHDAIMRKRVELLEAELTAVREANRRLVQASEAKAKAKPSLNMDSITEARRETLELDGLDLSFQAIGSPEKKKNIIKAWMDGWSEVRLMKHFKIRPAQLCLLIAYAKAYNICPSEPQPQPQEEFSDNAIFGRLRNFDDGVRIGTMAAALREWKQAGGPCGEIAKRHGFTLDQVNAYFNAQRSDSCTHFGDRVKTHKPECFTI